MATEQTDTKTIFRCFFLIESRNNFFLFKFDFYRKYDSEEVNY